MPLLISPDSLKVLLLLEALAAAAFLGASFLGLGASFLGASFLGSAGFLASFFFFLSALGSGADAEASLRASA